MALKDFWKRLRDRRIRKLINAVISALGVVSSLPAPLRGNLLLIVIVMILLYVIQEDEDEDLSSIEDILSRLSLPEELEVGEKEAYTIYRALSVIRWVLTKGRDEDVVELSDLIVSDPKEAAQRVIALYKEEAKAYNEKELEDVQGYIEKIFEMVKENKDFEGVRVFRRWLRNRRQYLMANIIAELSDILKGTLRIESRTIRLPDKPKIENPNDLQLRHLKGSKRLIPYSGKGFKKLKDELVRWARSLKDTKHKVGVRVIEGEGGAGKTRLAYEVIYELIKGGKVLGVGQEEKWTGLHINPTFYNEIMGNNVIKYGIFCANLPKIILIDYFEMWDEDLIETFLTDLLETCGPHRDKPIAVIFVGRRFEGSYLERAMTDSTNRGPIADLWEDIFGKTAATGEGKLNLGTTTERDRERVMSKEDREEIFKAAVEVFNRIYDVNKDADGFKEYPDTPLGVILMALLYVSGKESFSEKGSTKTVEVLKSTWERWEKSRWDGVIGTFSPSEIPSRAKKRVKQDIEALLIAATFLDGLDIKGSIIERLKYKLTFGKGERFEYVIEPILQQTGWLVGDTIHPIEPDPVADVVISEIADEETLRNILDAILPGEGSTEEEIVKAAEVYWNVLNVLTRAWWRHLLYWEEGEEDAKARGKLLKLLEFVHQKLKGLPEEVRHKILPYMYEYVIKTGFSVLRGEIFATIVEEAVGIFRKLAKHNPDKYQPYLAMSLNDLGTMYSYLGKYEEALKATKEAVGIFRKLAKQNPDKYLPDLAMSLNNLGMDYSSLGRYEEALEATKKAVEIRRKLAEHNPDKYLPDLAGSLNNLGMMYSSLGRYEEALEATKKAVEIRRKLAEHNPGKYLPDLAGSLSNLGRDYSSLGRYEEARKATEEAVEIYKKLAKRNPDKYMPNLATSLNNLGAMYSALGRYEKALKATKEAVEIRRKLAEHNPDKYLPDLATSLNNLGNRYISLGKYEEAIKALKEAVKIRRTLVRYSQVRYLPSMANSLLGLGNSYFYLGGYEEALEATKEAVEIYRELAKHNPNKHLPNLARSLMLLGYIFLRKGNCPEAKKNLQEALIYILPFAEKYPQRWGELFVFIYSLLDEAPC